MARASVQQGAVDFSDLATEVATANPEAVLFAGFNPEAGLLLRQLRDAGWDGACVAGDAVRRTAGCEFLQSLGELAEAAGEHVPYARPFGTEINDAGDTELLEIPVNADTGTPRRSTPCSSFATS